MRVLVTPTSLSADRDHPALAPLRDLDAELVFNDAGRPLTSVEVAHALVGVDAVIAGLDDFDAAALAGADRLRLIARYGAGVDNVDLDAAHARGVAVTRTAGANAAAVAEMAIALAFAAARGIPILDAGVRAGKWPRGRGIELGGRSFGVLGFGAIGRHVAALARGLGMRVSAWDPLLPDAEMAAAGVTPRALDDLCATSDVVSVHVPLVPTTRHLLDATRLAMLPPGGIVINTARGGILDEEAARAALDAGRLHAVAVDVYESEPPSASPLIGHPRVVSTPHSAGHTAEAVTRMAEGTVAAVIALVRGEEPEGLVSARRAPR
ncbi:NAD(P)-dependent oxidoreductase [Microbacterium aurantiacum]|uniref:NAD(P)-dependent oxidoreductase n=1 Tax=Microbacterium aurantiacum TaxID=162393 RepID=UPI003376119D